MKVKKYAQKKYGEGRVGVVKVSGKYYDGVKGQLISKANLKVLI